MWNFLTPLLAIGGGTFLASLANTAAANKVNAAVTNQQTIDQQIAQNASSTAAPGVSYLRQLVAAPDQLTPAQQQQLDLNRIAINNEIHGSNFAGSGRTAEALFKAADSDFINTALDSNRKLAVGAAEKLAGNTTTADNALMAEGAAGVTGATTGANATIANSKLFGQALGDVSSLINRQSKLSSLT